MAETNKILAILDNYLHDNHDTMEELQEIKRNMNKKKAYKR